MVNKNLKENRVELRINNELLERIDNWRKKNGDLDISRSDAIRSMIKSCCYDFKLSEQQRIFMLLILADLKGNSSENAVIGKKDIDIAIKAILEGHDWALKEIWDGCLVEPDNPDDVRFVYDVLDMFRVLTFSNKVLGDDKLLSDNLNFKGFDSNEESKLCSITFFILEHLDKYAESKKERCELEALRPMKPVYINMLKKYKRIYKGGLLTKEQIEQIIN